MSAWPVASVRASRINDARQIDRPTLLKYTGYLRQQVDQGAKSNGNAAHQSVFHPPPALIGALSVW
jgi:hypothetical protein